MRALLWVIWLCLCAVALMGQATTALPDWTVGVENSLQLGLADDFPAKGVQFKPGNNFPNWLRLSKTGLLKGRPPSVQGNLPVQIVLANGSHEIGRYDYVLNVKAPGQPVVISTATPSPIVIPGSSGAGHGGHSATPAPANPPQPSPPVVTQTNGIAKPGFAKPAEPGDMQITISQAVAPPSGTQAVVNRQNSSQPAEAAQAVAATNGIANLKLKNPVGYCEILSVSLFAKQGDTTPAIESDTLNVLPKPQITALGSTQLTATLPYLPPNPPGLSTAQIGVFVNGAQVDLQDPTGKPVKTVGISGQQTTVKLVNAVYGGASVVVRYTEASKSPDCSLSADSDPVKMGHPELPTITGAVIPAQTQIFASLPFGPPGTNGNRLTVYVNGTPAPQLDSSGSKVKFTAPDLSKEQALITLADPLAEEDVVRLGLVINNGDELKSKPVTVIDPGDLGRMRYYFTAGMVLSNNQGFQVQSGGTQAGLFIGLDVDRTWFALKPLGSAQAGAHAIGLNTYFDTRLTSVATQGVSPTSSTNTGSTVFLQSQKAATLAVGAYVPIMLHEFTPYKTTYTFFVAPIAKAGFSTLTDETPVQSGQTGVNSGTASAAVAGTGRFFTNYSYGGRLGVVKAKKTGHGDWDTNSSPELIHYFDFGVGQFGNFEAFRDYATQINPPVTGGCALPSNGVLPSGCLIPTGTSFITERPWRWYFEGFLKVPPIFILGVSANVGMGAPKAAILKGNTYPFTPPHDDLRFLLGAQFDFRQILHKLPSF